MANRQPLILPGDAAELFPHFAALDGEPEACEARDDDACLYRVMWGRPEA